MPLSASSPQEANDPCLALNDASEVFTILTVASPSSGGATRGGGEQAIRH